MHGTFDYNRTPLAPPGTKGLVHICPEDRQSWEPHALLGFYIGPAMDHYWCHRICTPSTTSSRICKTVKWYPRNVKMPTTSWESLILSAAYDLHSVLKTTQSAPALDLVQPSRTNTLIGLAGLFSHYTHKDKMTTKASLPMPLPMVPSPIHTVLATPPIVPIAPSLPRLLPLLPIPPPFYHTHTTLPIIIPPVISPPVGCSLPIIRTTIHKHFRTEH